MKQNKLYSWLTSLLVMVMLALVGQTALAQDVTFTFTGSNNTLSSNEVDGVRFTYYMYNGQANLYANSWDMTISSEREITKIEFTSGDMSGTTCDVGTMTSSNIWEGSANSVTFNNGGDKLISQAKVWLKSGPVEVPTYNFLGSNIPYITGGASSTLESGENLQVGDVFTGTDGSTLTFTAVVNAWSNSAQRLRLGNGTAFSIAAPEGYNISDIVLKVDANTLTGLSATGLSFEGTTKAVWSGEAASVDFSVTADSWVQKIYVTLVSAITEPTLYTVVVNDAPVGATVTLDDQDMTAGGQITVEKNLSLSNLSVTEPTGYYAEKEYDATTHTFTVTFKEYLQYPVVVTGTTDANAGVVYDGVTYHAGESVLTKTALTAADVTAAEVSDLEGTVTLDAGTFTVTYKAPEYIEFVTTGLSGSGQDKYNKTIGAVTIKGAIFNGYLDIWYSSWTATISSNTFNIAKIEFDCIDNLNISANVGSVDNSADLTKVWTGSAQSVTFSAGGDLMISRVRVYLEDLAPKEYTVSITGNPSEAKITYNGNQYADGDTFTAIGLNSEAITATVIEGYVYNVTIDGTTIKVEYSETPSIKIDYVTVSWGTDHLESGAMIESIPNVQVYMNEAFDYMGSVPVGMTFTDGDGNEQNITYFGESGYNKYFYFGFNETITAPGTYTLHIPAGAIKNTTTGLENKEINFQFVIPTPVQFAAPTLTPAEGTVESLKEFTLTAPAGVTFNTERDLSNITINGSTQYIYDYEYALDGSSLNFSLSGEYTTDGQAVVVLPLGFVRSTTNEYCPEITATYTVAYPWYEIHSYSALEPADGSEVKELSTIAISAPTGITFDCTSEGEERNITVSLNGKDEVVSANVYADRIVLNYATKAVGSYEFVIAANAIPANSGKKGNKAVSFSYSIAPTLSVSNVGWTTFCYDKPFTLADGYTPYMIQTAEDAVAEPVEILGAPKTETLKGYTCYNVNDFDNRATMSGGYITGSNLENKVEVTCGGNINYAGSGQSQDDELDGVFYEVSEGAWIEIKGVNGTQVVSVEALNWNPYEAPAYNYTSLQNGNVIRLEWTGNCWFGGLDINIAVPGEYEKPVIPANTGILVQGTPAQDVAYQVAYGATSDVTGNILTGCVADKTVTDTNKLFYKFSLNASRDAGSEGFYWDSNDGHSINMHGGKAYLILDADDAASIRGFRLFGGETEGITGVATESENAPAFNLQGQRVNKNNFRSGLYIQNGKKVLVK